MSKLHSRNKPFTLENAPLAQLAEQLTLNQRVVGSIPTRCKFRQSSAAFLARPKTPTSSGESSAHRLFHQFWFPMMAIAFPLIGQEAFSPRPILKTSY